MAHQKKYSCFFSEDARREMMQLLLLTFESEEDF